MGELHAVDGVGPGALGGSRGYPADIAIFQKRLALRLQAEGAAHPDVAAAVIAMRGAVGQSPAEFANAAGVVLADLTAAEAGKLPWEQLSTPLQTALEATRGLDLGPIRNSPGAV